MYLRTGFIAAGVAALLCAPAFGAEATITGELISQMCYAEDASHHGEEHKTCSVECATNGEPLAVLTADGTVYMITGALTADKNAKLIPHVSHQVALTGDVTEQSGQKSIAAVTLAMVR